MREVIQKVIEAENEAQRILEKAKGEAEQIVAEAAAQTRAQQEGVSAACRAEAEQVLDRARTAAEEEKRRLVEKAAADIANQFEPDAEKRRQAVKTTVRRVCGSP